MACRCVHSCREPCCSRDHEGDHGTPETTCAGRWMWTEDRYPRSRLNFAFSAVHRFCRHKCRECIGRLEHAPFNAHDHDQWLPLGSCALGYHCAALFHGLGKRELRALLNLILSDLVGPKLIQGQKIPKILGPMVQKKARDFKTSSSWVTARG